MEHTPGPWKCGVTLSTLQTQRWSKEKWAENDAIEGKSIFASFMSADNGRSRRLIARVENEHDAPLIAAAPDLLAVAKDLIEQSWAFHYEADLLTGYDIKLRERFL